MLFQQPRQCGERTQAKRLEYILSLLHRQFDGQTASRSLSGCGLSQQRGAEPGKEKSLLLSKGDAANVQEAAKVQARGDQSGHRIGL